MANRWTEEQQEAIDIEGCNVIVSAGAGSGKTAVLSERVLRKVEEGTHINELLILTFTKAAAKEMKDRIRKKLIDKNLTDEVNLIDGAYITTFDSYSLAVVKKYHHILNISSDIKVADATLLDIKKRDILTNIMDEYYNDKSDIFKDFVCKFSLKDDKDLIDIIIKLSNKLDLMYDRENYLDTYMNNFYSDQSINNSVDEYISSIMDSFNYFKSLSDTLSSLLDEKPLKSYLESVSSLTNINTYEELYNALIDVKLARTTISYSEDAKKVKEQVKSVLEELKKKCIYKDKNEMKEEILSTYNDTKILVEILLKLDTRNRLMKQTENLYDFNDISHLAIKLVREHSDIRGEITSSFKEILIDEYQDTSDNQEEFITLISNNNVYMVGDIKQSIYRFRNANPYIFKNKYDTYRDNQDKGRKIDLNKNFRSREEVLTNINMLFQDIMDDVIGGADYKNGHAAVFGNTTYNNEGKSNQEYNLDIKTYVKDEEKLVTDVEKEAFIIARDIKDKVANKYQIFDKDKKVMHDASYKDFVILMDKKKNFDLYKKIFEYLGVPLTVYREEKINNTDDFLVIHNLLKLVLLVYNNDFGVDFKYVFTSIARSFLFNMSDNDIFKILSSNNFIDTEIVQIAYSLQEDVKLLPVGLLFQEILNKFNYYEKVLSTTEIVKKEKCIEYLNNLIESMGSMKNASTINDVMYFLDKVIEKDYDIKYDNSNNEGDSVSIMSIHKSKGLEFPICYFADLQNKFNMREQREKVVFNNKYGILLPNINEESKPTIRMLLYREFDNKEEISERIRLFYVALTRCKEHMIIVCPEVEEFNDMEEEVIPLFMRKKYSSFYSILKSIWYKLDSYIEELEESDYSKDYLYKIKSSEIDYSSVSTIEVEELAREDNIKTEEHFSKSTIKLQTKEEKDLLEFGTKIHKVLEEIDFKNPLYDNFDITDFMKNKVRKFIESNIIQTNINNKFYKEYEFIEEVNDTTLHGIIDLMIEKEDEVIIIDYKLKNTKDDAYNKQLNGYKDYIERLTNKNTNTYLYSIMDEEFIRL